MTDRPRDGDRATTGPPHGSRPWRAVVVDDEPHGREAIRLALEDVPDFELVAEAADGSEAIEAVRRHRPDLLFLDIRMPDRDGFQVLEAMDPDHRPYVVMVSAYDEYALRAFEHRVVDYLLKPVDDERFEATLDHVRERLEEGYPDPRPLVEAVLRELGVERPGSGGADAHITRLKVRDGQRIRFVPVTEVDWFEADGDYVILHQADGTRSIRSTMRALEEGLDPSRFVRVHRSAIVNLDALKEVQPWFSGDHVAILRDGTQVRVSRRYRDRLLKDAL